MSSVFYGFALQNLSSWKAKPMLLVCKTIGFENENGKNFCTLFIFGLQGFEAQGFKVAHRFREYFAPTDKKFQKNASIWGLF